MNTESASKPSRSLRPEPVSKKSITRQAARAAARREAKERRRAQVESCARIIAECATEVSESARSYFHASVTDDAAVRVAKPFLARDVTDGWNSAARALLPAVLAGQLLGYGPVRLCYAAELASELATKYGAPDAPATTATPAPKAPQNIRALKLAVAQALRILGIAATAGQPTTSPDARVSHSLEQLAQAVAHAQATVPADVLADAGLSAEVVDALHAAASATLQRRDAKVDAKTAAHMSARAEAVLVGRLVHEARRMLAAARASRKMHSDIPVVRSELVATRKRKTHAAEPVAPVTPVNNA